MKIITIATCKGGTGKTSLTQNLGYELTQKGGRVLVVDFDPQSNLTITYGFDPSEDRPTVYHALETPTEASRAILQTGDGVDLLPAGLDLAFAEQRYAPAFDRNERLTKALESIDGYDVVLIDTPPSLGFYAFNSLMAATKCLIPCQAQPFSFRMIAPTIKLIQLVQSANQQLSISGIVITMYDRRTTISKSVEDATRNTYGDLVRQTMIPVNVAISEAQLDGKAVARHAPSSAGAHAYRALTEELFDV